MRIYCVVLLLVTDGGSFEYRHQSVHYEYSNGRLLLCLSLQLYCCWAPDLLHLVSNDCSFNDLLQSLKSFYLACNCSFSSLFLNFYPFISLLFSRVFSQLDVFLAWSV